MSLLRKPQLLFGLIFTLLFSFTTLAQYKRSHKELRADRHFDRHSYYKASKLYEKVIKKYPNNERARLKLARAYFSTNNLGDAKLYYSDIIHKRYLVKSKDYLNYAQILQSLEDFEGAEKWARKFLDINPRNVIGQNLIYSLENVTRYYQDSSRYVVTTLNINTEAAEFSPSYFKDGLVFVSSRTPKYNFKRNYSRDHSKYLNLYHSEALIGAAMMTTPVKLKGTINNRFHQGPATFYNDYQEVIYTGNDAALSREFDNNLKLYSATLSSEGQKWENVTLLPFNSESHSTGHPSMSADGKVLYFVSNKPGGQGGTDLYKIHLQENGWSTPINLGPKINTAGNELFPFIDSRDRLYFSSNGHGGLGGLDIFYVDISSNGQSVRNVGYPINSTRDDFGLIYEPERHSGYFSSDRGGQSDLFKFIDNGHLLKVLVSSDKVGPIDAAKVSLESEGVLITERETSNTGRAEFVVNSNKNYQIKVESEGHKVIHTNLPAPNRDLTMELTAHSKNPEPTDGTLLEIIGQNGTASYVLTEDNVIEIKQLNDLENGLDQLMHLNNIQINHRVRINPVLYAFDQATINERYATELDKLAGLMKKYDFLEFELGSHTDSVGSDAYNQYLSELRANAALNYLTGKHIDSGRLLAKGYGESSLTNSCSDTNPCEKEKHRINRRTEFRLIYMDENQVVSNY